MHENLTLDLSLGASPRVPPGDGIVSIGRKSMKVTPVFYAYWRFATERQKIFFQRLRHRTNLRLTDDPVLSTYRFTNAYRASDRVSQFLIRNVIYRNDLPDDPDNIFFRIILFKLFNKIETWQHLESAMGALIWPEVDLSQLDTLLSDRLAAGDRIYSAAYIMPSASSAFGQKLKRQNHLLLIKQLMSERFPSRIAESKSLVSTEFPSRGGTE